MAKPTTTTTTAPAPVAPAGNAPATTLAPTAVHAAPSKGKGVATTAVVGNTYGIAVAVPNGAGAPGAPATVVLPYAIPGWAGAPGASVACTLASVAPNWLGTNGLPLLCTVYASAHGSVVVQRNGNGVKVNAYPANMANCGLAVVALPVANVATPAPVVAPTPAPAK